MKSGQIDPVNVDSKLSFATKDQQTRAVLDARHTTTTNERHTPADRPPNQKAEEQEPVIHNVKGRRKKNSLVCNVAPTPTPHTTKYPTILALFPPAPPLPSPVPISSYIIIQKNQNDETISRPP